jgi:CubicO group peptidase (beta-lactamase class C family)
MPPSPETAVREVERRLVVTRDGGVATLEERMAHHHVPGVALALSAGSEAPVEAAYGVKEAGRSDPVTPATRFQACSISKPVAVLGMLRLVERGVLDLDADVNEMLTSWQVPPNASWQPRVTLRQIASHSAGLTVGGFPGYARGVPLPTLTQVLTGSAPANTAGIRVDTLPSVEFRYAGGGTTVLQQVLEDVTGRPFADLMRELVLEPLEMTRSGYTQPLPDELRAEAATAHGIDGVPVEAGGTSIRSSPPPVCGRRPATSCASRSRSSAQLPALPERSSGRRSRHRCSRRTPALLRGSAVSTRSVSACSWAARTPRGSGTAAATRASSAI